MDQPLPSRTLRWGVAVGVSLTTLALMIVTERHTAVALDEEISLRRMERVRAWLSAVTDPGRAARDWDGSRFRMLPDDTPMPRSEDLSSRFALLRPKVVRWFWPFAREEPHGHPPFYALVGLVGDLLAPAWPELPRARLGTMLAFSLMSGLLYASITRRVSPWAGATASAAWVLQPSMFALGHYATYDSLLTSLWVASILGFLRAVESPRFPWVGSSVFGLLLGAAASTKLTGWLLPVPFVAWVMISRSGRGLRVLMAGGSVAAATVYAVNPSWWAHPTSGVDAFLRSNLQRAITVPIPVQFLGRVYLTPIESLPWYNTILWTILVTPVGFLSLALVGAWRAGRRGDPPGLGRLAFIHWGFLLALRAMPNTPGHDGVRQFLPAFGCLAILAGLGADAAVGGLRRWGKRLVAIAIAEGVGSIALMMPVPLSYYSPLVGGPPGAAALGMEPTYYWDALGDHALGWLREHTPPGSTVAFADNTETWAYLVRTGKLPAAPHAPGPRAWYVVQNRPGSFTPLERDLIAHAEGWVIAKTWGVPLIWAFPSREINERIISP